MTSSLHHAIGTSGMQQQVIEALSAARLGKYLHATQNNPSQAIRLYVLNAKLSAALFIDLHFIEICLRNRFHEALTNHFGAEWFTDPGFLSVLDPGARDMIQRACRNARWRNGHGQNPGKVVAELTFGFWLGLADRRREHALWVPCLNKAFSNRRVPRRGDFARQFDKLRMLRNRIAHHEPVFHFDLVQIQLDLKNAAQLIAPELWPVIQATSTLKRASMKLTRYRRLHGL